MHIGHSSINTATRPLALRKILHVPEIAKHILSVHKFTRDNDVFFEYHPWHFSIKDRRSRRSLLDGQCKSGLYAISLRSSMVSQLDLLVIPSGMHVSDTLHPKSFGLFCI